MDEELKERKKSDKNKVAIAARLRHETTMTLKWICGAPGDGELEQRVEPARQSAKKHIEMKSVKSENRLACGADFTCIGSHWILAALAFIWPLCSAELWISYGAEKHLVHVSVGILLVILLVWRLYGVRRRREGGIGGVLVAANAITAFVVICIASESGNRLFYSYSKHIISTNTWFSVTSALTDLRVRSTVGSRGDTVQLTEADLPRILDGSIGRRQEFYSGFVYPLTDTKSVDSIVLVYGSRSRCWGIYGGADPKDRWPDAMAFKIGSGMWYFVGTQN